MSFHTTWSTKIQTYYLALDCKWLKFFLLSSTALVLDDADYNQQKNDDTNMSSFHSIDGYEVCNIFQPLFRY